MMRTGAPEHLVQAGRGDFDAGGGPLAPVRGKANPADILKAKDNERLASEAKTHCQECIRARKLDMKLVDVEVAHDRSKMAFYFTAPARTGSGQTRRRATPRAVATWRS